MKKLLKCALGLIMAVSFVFAMSEGPGWMNLVGLFVCAVSGYVLDKMGAFDRESDEA